MVLAGSPEVFRRDLAASLSNPQTWKDEVDLERISEPSYEKGNSVEVHGHCQPADGRPGLLY